MNHLGLVAFTSYPLTLPNIYQFPVPCPSHVCPGASPVPGSTAQIHPGAYLSGSQVSQIWLLSQFPERHQKEAPYLRDQLDVLDETGHCGRD